MFNILITIAAMLFHPDNNNRWRGFIFHLQKIHKKIRFPPSRKTPLKVKIKTKIKSKTVLINFLNPHRVIAHKILQVQMPNFEQIDNESGHPALWARFLKNRVGEVAEHQQ